MQLPPRLSAIAGFVPVGRRVVDVGTDHALLPVYLIKNGKCPGAVAGDVHEGPYQAAGKAVAAAGLADRIDVRLGDGLTIINSGEVEVAVIAGMGGGTIRDIIRNSLGTASMLERLVLQPMVDGGALRTWLVKNGWRLADETLVEEGGTIYEVIAAERGREEETDPLLLEIGPRLVEKKDPLLKRRLTDQARSLKRIIYNLARSTSPEAQHKKTELLARLGEMKKVLAWL
ncbi:MAG: tRNA (adenine(22)-N(1))-methyltransferase [Bacillota bacterium]